MRDISITMGSFIIAFVAAGALWLVIGDPVTFGWVACAIAACATTIAVIAVVAAARRPPRRRR